MNNWLFYLLIISVKTIEVSLATIRINLITKNEKLKGSLVGLIEVTIWILVVSAVLTDLTNDPLQVVAYAIGFALGNYMGILIENWIGLGTVKAEIIVEAEKAPEIIDYIRSNKFAVTVVSGQGMVKERKVLIVVTPRKRFPVLKNLLKNIDGLFIHISETKAIYGGYKTLRK
ncbi:MAG: hypothetical protein CSB16_00080 [Clostridiales bacterium]|nr:MAG: hypothetical protein CSB16_00080 [Clostridiales bacterium]